MEETERKGLIDINKQWVEEYRTEFLQITCFEGGMGKRSADELVLVQRGKLQRLGKTIHKWGKPNLTVQLLVSNSSYEEAIAKP